GHASMEGFRHNHLCNCARGGIEGRVLNYTSGEQSSTAIATASPPPKHKASTPIFPPRRRNALIRVTSVRAPLAPMGWPSATAPPCTLTRSWGIPSSLIAAIGTTEKASFISNKSTFATLSDSVFNSLLIAPIGAVVNHSGSWEKVE